MNVETFSTEQWVDLGIVLGLAFVAFVLIALGAKL